jgi:hypothetical protein
MYKMTKSAHNLTQTITSWAAGVRRHTYPDSLGCRCDERDDSFTHKIFSNERACANCIVRAVEWNLIDPYPTKAGAFATVAATKGGPWSALSGFVRVKMKSLKEGSVKRRLHTIETGSQY